MSSSDWDWMSSSDDSHDGISGEARVVAQLDGGTNGNGRGISDATEGGDQWRWWRSRCRWRR